MTTLTMPVASIIRVLPLVIILAPGGACGGGDGTTTPSMDGPFLITFGAQAKLFSLKAGDAQVSCRPKPSLNEFELTATSLGSDGAGSFKFILKGYQPGKSTYEMKYEIGQPLHEVAVEIPVGYKYKFFQAFRTDNDEIFNSHCNVELASEEKGNSTAFSGSLYCVMIWSDTASKDYSTDILNNYIDLAAKFECEY